MSVDPVRSWCRGAPLRTRSPAHPCGAPSVSAARIARPTSYIVRVNVAVLVPVKRFAAAKGRLVDVLEPEERARFARWMAGRVLDAVTGLPTFVACDDAEVREWAERRGATVVWGPGLGLNGAVDDGVQQIADRGFDHVVVTHADLPRAEPLARVADAGRIILVPDRRRDGTNVMAFPTATPIRAEYGAGSFDRHATQAAAYPGIEVEHRDDPDLSLDVDTPSDLGHPLIMEVLPEWLRTNPVNRPCP